MFSHWRRHNFYPVHGLDTEDCPTISGIPAADDILCIRRPVSYVCYLAPHRTVHASARAGARCDSLRAVLGPDSIGLLLYTLFMPRAVLAIMVLTSSRLLSPSDACGFSYFYNGSRGFCFVEIWRFSGTLAGVEYADVQSTLLKVWDFLRF